ncbi:MAG: bifunctional (p)ppGpp synthetase/guanosine-3',5'-bis(diphosphate) 3'-pyrophosphohydrolase [Candidatus Woesearchaeota archaeon]|nr:bifunctional (p)ppGpp synthetase/guanosine-3',5'-bis(diphosphate) 3'-pyrophosphohydrolase [Candidatus Woesearchaeota archaeon]
MQLKELLKKIKEYNPKADLDLISKAYDYADEFHKDVKRLSGELFIQHPLNTAYILAQLKLDIPSIAAALLHDVVEDSNVSIEKIKQNFGEEIANLVDGVTKISKLKYQDQEQRNNESIRKMLLASTKDIRVIIIKLADKLHNMRTIKYLPEEKRKKISQETLDIYAPLAYRLGIASIKWELEDLAFKQLQPEIYQKIKEKFGKKRIYREIEIRRLKSMIEKELKKHDIQAKVLGRPKHFYSIYKKMITKHRTFDEIHDLIALRIITDTVKDCYEILGIIHSLWTPIPGEFNDYIAMSKSNLYQSLHTAVIAFNQPVEFQIRTQEMDNIAEEGIAAHWKYKGVSGDKDFDKKLSWLKQVLQSQQESEDTKDFIDILKVDLFEDEIYVFTPKGDIISLPKGSCSIDFAYAVHTNVGDKCTGAVVNGRIVPLRCELKNGDIINILTSKNAFPRRDWLKIVKTTLAKTRIRKGLRLQKKIPLNIIKKNPIEKEIIGKEDYVIIKKQPNAKIKLSKCCSPIPGDKIVASLIKSRTYSIHKIECPYEAKKPRLKVEWNENINTNINIKIIAYDRVGLFADIFNTISSTGTNLKNAKAKSIGNDMAECSVTFLSENTDHIKDIISRIRKLQGVRKIYLD